MKTIQIFGENLKENLLLGITSTRTVASSSFGIRITFLEKGELQKAKLILQTKGPLHTGERKKEILCFTGILGTEKGCHPYMGAYLTNEGKEECWISIIESETEPRN